MSITLFGVVWLLIITYVYLFKNVNSKVTILFFSMVLQCDNVVIIGEKGIGPQIITSACFVLSCLVLPCRSLVLKDSKSKPFLILLSVFCLYVLINAYLCKTLLDIYRDIILLYVYLSASICLYRIRNCISNMQIWNIIIKLYYFLLFIGFVQFLSTTHIIPKWLLTEFLYNDTSESVYFHIPISYARIMSTFMEPSYFSGLLCGFIGITIYNKTRIKKANLIIIIGIIELVLTFSTTGYLTFICVLISLVLFDKSNHNIKKYLPIFIIILLFVLVSWDTLINNVILNKLDTGSGQTRLGWNLKAIDEFYSHPIFGSGYMNIRASSLFLTIIANLGIIGLSIYLITIFLCIFPFVKKNMAKDYLPFSVRLVVLSVVISQMIACPDFSLCTFWLCVYMVVVSESHNCSKRIKLKIANYFLMKMHKIN